MIRLRHLLARRLTHPAAASLLLLVVAFRLLLPPGLMLSESPATDGGGLVICSGHGALADDTLGLSLDPAAKAAAADLAHALAGSPAPADHAHSGDICPFSAALAFGVALTLLVSVHWLRARTRARPVRPADDALLAAAPSSGPLGARAPPRLSLA
ncbi:MAG: hypothetical protein V4764_04625 [Burkholderia sp.]